jgi:uncharacterized YccA/Bax inhibitor family protein
MRSSNPALRDKTFAPQHVGTGGGVMTLEGAVNRTIVLLGILGLAATWTWGMAVRGNPAVQGVIGLGVIGGLVVALVTIFRQRWAPVTAPLYAALEGLALGGISGVVHVQYRRLPLQALALTAGTLLCLLLAYRSGLIRATENFRLGVVSATGAVALLYLVSIGMRFFGMEMPLLHEATPMGIGLSLVIVAIAALNLVLDFDSIEKGAEAGLPRYMEWYAGFGLLVTLVWLYLEILRLLTKLQRRN